jgi:hypothetical protein
MEAARIGYVDLEWPRQYRTAKMQLVRNLERERARARPPRWRRKGACSEPQSQGRHAVVTRLRRRGIGAAIARALADAGARVTLTGRNEQTLASLARPCGANCLRASPT